MAKVLGNLEIDNGKLGVNTSNPLKSIQVGGGSTSEVVRVYYSDASYIDITGFGLEMGRATCYIRPTSDKNKDIYLGSDGRTWDTISHNANVTSFSTDTTEHMRITNTGNVGIGTTTPDEKLHIVGDLKIDSDIPRIYLADSSHNPDYSIGNVNGGFFVFDDTNSAYRIYVDNAGKVGIGTNLPEALLDVNGTAQMSTGITENVHYVGGSIQHWGDSGTGLYFETDELRFYTGNAEEMRLENDGDLHVDGDVIAYSTTVSDERLKDDIKTIDSACEKVYSLRGVEYTWNSGSRKGQREIGVIAQEVEKVIPEIVREKKLALVDDEVYKTVDYEKLVAVLIEANKELQDRVSKLESKLDGITD